MSLALFQSPRFWGIVAVAVLGALRTTGVLDALVADAWIEAIQYIVGSAVLVRTVDRTAERIGAKKGK